MIGVFGDRNSVFVIYFLIVLYCLDMDECKINFCKNLVSCVNLVGSYWCDCKYGYIGIKCEIGKIYLLI